MNVASANTKQKNELDAIRRGGLEVTASARRDNLPEGCPGCRETLDGKIVCCQQAPEHRLGSDAE